MKKSLLVLFAMLVTLGVSAQGVKCHRNQLKDQAVKVYTLTGNEQGEAAAPANYRGDIIGVNILGSTYYDLQTNGSMSNKLVAHPDGTVSAVWTTCGPSAMTRGTGYNYFDGSAWTLEPSSDRIENARGGWGTICTAGDAEIVASHDGIEALIIATRPHKGTGEWTCTKLYGPEASNGSQTSTALLWPCLASNGNTIHLIACTESNPGFQYAGIATCLVYYRGEYNASSNTITWEEPRVVGDVTPEDMSAFGGDSYAIAAKGDNVAVLVAPAYDDVFLWKSTDNGVNFTRTVVAPTSVYQASEDGTMLGVDTPYVPDGACGLALDDAGKAHIAFGINRIVNYEPSTSSHSYFPAYDGMLYWNENMAPFSNPSTHTYNPDTLKENGFQVFTRPDLDGDDTAWYYGQGDISSFPSYGVSMTSVPQLIAQGNNVYIVYSSCLDFPFMDMNSEPMKYLRGVFAARSTDGGATWDNGISWLSYNKSCYYVDDWENYVMEEFETDYSMECVFPAIAAYNGKMHVIWQKDYFAGSAVKDESVAVCSDESYIDYMSLDLDQIGIYNNTEEICQGMWIDETGIADNTLSGMKLYPNPASSNVNVLLTSTEAGDAVLSIVNIMGQLVYSENVAVNEGHNMVKVNVNDLQAGVYMINIKTSKGTSTQKLVVK